MNTRHPHSIFVEEAKILSKQSFPAEQHVMRLNAPKCAAHAKPGSFIHLQCDTHLPLRRPFSIMRTSPIEGWIDILYKIIGEGTQRLSTQDPGSKLSVMGPIGKPFSAHKDRPLALLLGGGVGIPPMIFLGDWLRQQSSWHPFLIMGSEVPFPFSTRPSQFLVPGIPEGVIAAMSLLEDWGLPSRLTSLQGYAGCYEGVITDLARLWLKALTQTQRKQVEVFACGPHPMLSATTEMAREFEIPCQVSLEEYMACAVGGCAGCVVEVITQQGRTMKRVCVDGPVFDAETVF